MKIINPEAVSTVVEMNIEGKNKRPKTKWLGGIADGGYVDDVGSHVKYRFRTFNSE